MKNREELDRIHEETQKLNQKVKDLETRLDAATDLIGSLLNGELEQVTLIVKRYGEPDKKVKRMEIKFAGMDADYIWFTFIYEDGTKEETGYFKEDCY